MDKKTFDALCTLKYTARPEQMDAVREVQQGLDNLSRGSMVTVSTTTEADRIIQKLEVCGEVGYRVAQVGAKQMDDALRARLLELGWLPPEEAEKLRNLRWEQGERGEG